MFNRLLKIITVLCLALGTFFGGISISAEETNGEQTNNGTEPIASGNPTSDPAGPNSDNNDNTNNNNEPVNGETKSNPSDENKSETNDEQTQYTVSFMRGSWDDADPVAIDGNPVTRTTVTRDNKQYLVLVDGDPLLTYVNPLDSNKPAEGWAYRVDNHPDAVFSMGQLKEGIEISGNINMFPVRKQELTFYREDKQDYQAEGNVFKKVTTELDGTIANPDSIGEPTSEGKKFLAWYWYSGPQEAKTKEYVDNLSGMSFRGDFEFFPEWESTASDITVTPNTMNFGSHKEGYGNVEQEFTIKNTSQSDINLWINGHGEYFHINDFSGELTLQANESRTLSVHLQTGLPAGTDGSSKQYSFRFPISRVDGDRRTPITSVQGNVTIEYNTDAHACSIIPQTNDDTRSLKITCTNDMINNWVSGKSLGIDFQTQDYSSYAHLNVTPERKTDTETQQMYLFVSEEKIIADGLYLNGNYRTSLRVYGTDHQQEAEYTLNDGAYIPMHTEKIVKVVNPEIVAGDRYTDGIHIRINDSDYLQTIYNKAMSKHQSGDSSLFSYMELRKEIDGSHFNYSLGGREVTRKFVNEPDLVNHEIIIPTEVIAENMVEAGTYGYSFHVPGYKDIEVQFNNPSTASNRLKIVNGAQDPGTLYFQQNDDYSVTLFAGEKSDTSSNYDLIKEKWIGFQWENPGGGGSGAGWDRLPDDAIFDDKNKSVTLPADSAPLQGLYFGMPVGTTTVNALRISIKGCIQKVAFSARDRSSTEITIKNRYQLPPGDFRTYILGTKVLMITENKDFLEKVQRLQFTRTIPDPTHPNGGTFSIGRLYPGFSSVTESQTWPGKWEFELKLNINQIKHLMPDASQEYKVQVESTYYKPSENPFGERFTAMEFVNNVNGIKDESQPSETDLENLDKDALTSGQFDHVHFTGGVDPNKPSDVDISGSIAGAITNDDMDSTDDQTINIKTTIEEGISAADEQDIMNYLNGHHLGEVKHAVGITVVKTYKDQEPQVLHEIGVNSAIVFSDLPALEPGREYIIVTKHNGKVKTIPVTYKNGQVIGYTKEFSSFVLTTQEKSSPSGDSSKKTTPTKTDNVVTCQMAGFPANYAWNEAAKACQPGYIDANGQFRVTKASKVPNTYDKGIGGSAVSLLIATIFAIGAAYMLKKY